jgi:hypothetical protein
MCFLLKEFKMKKKVKNIKYKRAKGEEWQGKCMQSSRSRVGRNRTRYKT